MDIVKWLTDGGVAGLVIFIIVIIVTLYYAGYFKESITNVRGMLQATPRKDAAMRSDGAAVSL